MTGLIMFMAFMTVVCMALVTVRDVFDGRWGWHRTARAIDVVAICVSVVFLFSVWAVMR